MADCRYDPDGSAASWCSCPVTHPRLARLLAPVSWLLPGRQAIVVYLGGAFGPTGHCGISDGGDQTGPCPFCGGPRHSELEGRRPRYRLRLDTEREE